MEEQNAHYADMFAAMGKDARLRILRLLVEAHPEGMNVGEIGGELGIPGSKLSHDLDQLENQGLVGVRREAQFLRYTANMERFHEFLRFLYTECRTRNLAVKPASIVKNC
jgi:ArsR family transcriptional regulator, arsenate/arsenite/antimonite-responsive transcriptional repressor